MRSPGKGGETKNPKYGRKTPARASVSETDKKFNLIKTITTMKYLIRSVKYFIALCVLYLIIMALMLLTNTSVLTPSETFSALVHSTRGQVLIVAVVLLSALYPKFGFIRRQEIGSLRKNREQILNAFVSEGFKPVRESEHEMVFRADSLFKRLTLLFEDEIRVTQTGEWITIEGIRRGVAGFITACSPISKEHAMKMNKKRPILRRAAIPAVLALLCTLFWVRASPTISGWAETWSYWSI